ncbi:MAG TPA: BON domain-containing protein [Vicinamibacterales bacterium]|nr:BON domain-containing protein [Vicinamibacterales bacterium]
MTTLRPAARLLIALLLAAPLPAGCAKAKSSPARTAAVDDAVLSTKVKTAFINDLVIGEARIDVETSKGVVTLSGRVKSKEEETKAVELARTVKGVTDVKSTLQIQP